MGCRVGSAGVRRGAGAPGGVWEADSEGAAGAAADGAVVLTSRTTQDGEARCPSTLSGKTVEIFDTATRQRLTDRNAEICKADDFYAARLEALDPIELPMLGARTEAAQHAMVEADARRL